MPRAMSNIYDELRASHARQRRLCSSMVRTRASNPAKREALFRELRIELAAHAAAEERYLYAPILMYDMGLDSARHALAEHHEMDELVEDLQALDSAGQAWGTKAGELVHKVRHHLKEEETKFFQVSGKLLSATQKVRLAKQYRNDYGRMLGVAAER
jgi:cytochrome c556